MVHEDVDLIKIDVEGHGTGRDGGHARPDRAIAPNHRLGMQRVWLQGELQHERP